MAVIPCPIIQKRSPQFKLCIIAHKSSIKADTLPFLFKRLLEVNLLLVLRQQVKSSGSHAFLLPKEGEAKKEGKGWKLNRTILPHNPSHLVSLAPQKES